MGGHVGLARRQPGTKTQKVLARVDGSESSHKGKVSVVVSTCSDGVSRDP